MIRIVTIAALGLAASLESKPASALPPGEYDRSCRDFREMPDAFSATCRDGSGNWIRSTVPFSSCSGRLYLKNVNGTLRCTTT